MRPAGSTVRKRIFRIGRIGGLVSPNARPGATNSVSGGVRLENPAHPLLRLHDRDCRIAVVGHERRQRVALGQDVGRALGARPRIEIARKLAKALEPDGGSAGPSGTAPVKALGEGQRREGKPDRRGPQRRSWRSRAERPEAPARRASATQSAARIAAGRIKRREPVALNAVVGRVEKEIDRRRRDRAGEHAPRFVGRAGQRRRAPGDGRDRGDERGEDERVHEPDLRNEELGDIEGRESVRRRASELLGEGRPAVLGVPDDEGGENRERDGKAREQRRRDEPAAQRRRRRSARAPRRRRKRPR